MITPLLVCQNLQPIKYSNPAYNRVSQHSYGLDSVSFTSKNLLSKGVNAITEAVNDTVLLTKNIGFGSEGTVYKIQDTNYCVKILNKSPEKICNWSLNIKPEERVNHIVAKANNGAVIMKYIEGEALNWAEKPKELAELPKLTYKRLLTQIQNAYDNCMALDPVPSNIIYNQKDKTLTAIDFRDLDYYEDLYEHTPIKDVFMVLKANEKNDFAELYNRRLGGKLLSVVIDEIASGKKPEFDVEKEDLTLFFNKLRFTQNDGNVPPQFDILHRTINNIIDLSKDSTQSKEQNGQIKVAQCLIKQVLG